MKLYLSVDIEGVACICDPAEGDKSHPGEYAPMRDQMSAEALAACRGAFAAGAQAVVVKDAHWTGRNMDATRFIAPEGRSLELIRGWSGHPFAMVQGIDESFSALAFVGYHSAAGSGGNPLAHTLSGRVFGRVELNGERASEARLYGLAAASVGVPLVFLAGDAALCEEVAAWAPGLVTVATIEGFGASVQSLSPAEAVRRIEAGVRRALAVPPPLPVAVPERLECRVRFNKARDAYARSFYPGARMVADDELVFESRRIGEVLAFLWTSAG